MPFRFQERTLSDSVSHKSTSHTFLNKLHLVITNQPPGDQRDNSITCKRLKVSDTLEIIFLHLP